MLQTIPTRIAGANILRQTPDRRTDGSAVMVRRISAAHDAWPLPYEEQVLAEFGFTCEPGFTRQSVQRGMRCLSGEVFACIVDARLDSASFGHWQSFCLSEGDARTLTVPSGVALGWQVLSESATIEILSSHLCAPQAWRWLRWNDRDLVIEWPERPTSLASHLRPSRHLRSIADRHLPASRQRDSRTVRSNVNRHGVAQAADVRQPDQRVSASVVDGRSDVTKASGNEAKNLHQTNSKPLAQRPAEARPELILVIGSSGQLGRDLCRELRCLGTVVGACRTPDTGSLLPVPVLVDISRPASLRQAIRQVRPTLIVNAAGLTDVDVAETQPRLAQMVNATAPAIMAEEALRIGAGLVHFCSSMVFDGSGERPWRETDCPDPQNQYARTKLIGTQAILDSDVAHLILRCGWLYSTHGDNYVRRLIDTLSYRNVVALADDHFGAPTSTNFMARLVTDLLCKDSSTTQPGTRRPTTCDLASWLSQQGGLYHASTLGRASKLEVGDQIVATCRQHALPSVLRKLEGRSLNELPALAQIPGNCSLDPSRLALKFQLQLPSWQSDLNQQIDLMLSSHGLPLSGVA
jgi:dTDP-4-dehydrorhamnose reductase